MSQVRTLRHTRCGIATLPDANCSRLLADHSSPPKRSRAAHTPPPLTLPPASPHRPVGFTSPRSTPVSPPHSPAQLSKFHDALSQAPPPGSRSPIARFSCLCLSSPKHPPQPIPSHPPQPTRHSRRLVSKVEEAASELLFSPQFHDTATTTTLRRSRRLTRKNMNNNNNNNNNNTNNTHTHNTNNNSNTHNTHNTSSTHKTTNHHDSHNQNHRDNRNHNSHHITSPKLGPHSPPIDTTLSALHCPEVCPTIPLADHHSRGGRGVARKLLAPARPAEEVDAMAVEEEQQNQNLAPVPAAAAQGEPDAEEEEEEGEAVEAPMDPMTFIRCLPPRSVAEQAVCMPCLPKKTRNTPRVTLVLDLDETLVHSSVTEIDNADVQLTVELFGEEFKTFVRKRPGMDEFLDRVSQLFETVCFTASKRVYAEKLLKLLDPDCRRIRHRVYRESCVSVCGNFLKDLTVLGRDLAHVAIVDNSPHAFAYQLDNGIPIESWFEDSSDRELHHLLPFLEQLAQAQDVRPLIRERFRLREKVGLPLTILPSNNNDDSDMEL